MIRDREQPSCYEVYKSVVGVPHPNDPEGKTCPQCNLSMAENATYCRACGAYPV